MQYCCEAVSQKGNATRSNYCNAVLSSKANRLPWCLTRQFPHTSFLKAVLYLIYHVNTLQSRVSVEIRLPQKHIAQNYQVLSEQTSCYTENVNVQLNKNFWMAIQYLKLVLKCGFECEIKLMQVLKPRFLSGEKVKLSSRLSGDR